MNKGPLADPQQSPGHNARRMGSIKVFFVFFRILWI
jgi:hypothetical protein